MHTMENPAGHSTIRKCIMKKPLAAALLALPFLALAPRQAAATCCSGCYNLSGCWHLKVCYFGKLSCWKQPFNHCCYGCKPACGEGGCCGAPQGGCAPGGYGGYAGAPGGGGCPGGDCNGCCGLCGCTPYVPGPWYLFWPNGMETEMGAPVGNGQWTLEDHFQLPAPTGFPYYPAPLTIAADYNAHPLGCFPYQVPPGYGAHAAPANFQSVGYYPTQAPAYAPNFGSNR
jgi:hypothetical protein